uniref:hypothetical protein n=1 Tax=Stappia sp. TaxID=1870903 RepID=UPI003BA8B0BB
MMMPLTLPSGTGMRARHFAAIVLALALVGTAYVAHTVGNWMNFARAPSTWSERDVPLPITLGTLELSVPANLMRRVEERVAGGALERVNLAVLWPSLEGYSELRSRMFSDSGDMSPVFHIALADDATTMETSERLKRVWLSLASGEALPGPDGLALLPLPGDTSSGTDFVAHNVSGDGVFAARCFTPRDRALAANCERSIRVGERLFVTYRFRQAWLSDWRSLDARISALAGSLLR